MSGVLDDCWISEDDVRNVAEIILQLLDKDLMGAHLTRSEYRKDLIMGAFDKFKYDLLKRATDRQKRSDRMDAIMAKATQPLPQIRPITAPTGHDPLAQAPERPKSLGEKAKAEFGI